MEEKQVFLIQKSGYIPAEHATVSYKDRSYADETLKYGYYRNEGWDVKRRDQDFGKVKVDDYLLVYCTGDVEESPSQIKYIYEVIRKEKVPEDDVKEALEKGRISQTDVARFAGNYHILHLKPHRKLRRGLELALIRQWVQEGTLSERMNNCGKVGFNICQVSNEDYETIIEWDKKAPEPVVSLEPLEEDLRKYIIGSPLTQTLGDNYKNFKLFEDNEGRTGELYTTSVGQIDLLYRDENSGDFLVIELKRTLDTPDSAVGQIARYIGWVKEHLAKERSVYGLLIVHSASEELKYAVKALRDCSLVTYEVTFKFARIE